MRKFLGTMLIVSAATLSGAACSTVDETARQQAAEAMAAAQRAESAAIQAQQSAQAAQASAERVERMFSAGLRK